MTNIEASVVSKSSVTSEDLLRSAMEALRAGDAVRAANIADEARLLSLSSRVLIVFAAISHVMGRDVDALAMLDQASKQEPEVANYPDAAAAILLKLGRKADGIFNLKLGTHLPSDPFLDQIIGDYFGNMNDIFDSFIENRPLMTARLMAEQGLYSAALKHLETYIGVSGGDEESFALTVDCALQIGATKEAGIALGALTALSDKYPKLSQYNLGLAILRGIPSEVSEAIQKLTYPLHASDALSCYQMLSLSPMVGQEVLRRGIDTLSLLTKHIPGVPSFSVSSPQRTVILGFMCRSIDAALEAILMSLKDRVKIKVYLLGNSLSPAIQRIKAGFEDVRDVASIDDATLVEMVRFDQVSILFDCIGAAPFARLALWKTRMAPIQILWDLNDDYDDLDSYDYRVIGEPDSDKSDVRVINLGLSMRYPLPPAELMGRVAEIRTMKVDRDNVPQGVMRLLAPTAGYLLPDATLDLYMSILEAVPNATITFVAISELGDPLVSRILSIAGRKGCAERVDLIAPADFIKQRHEIMLDADLILDSFPYGNFDLVTECLWIGAPILVLAGSKRRERVSSALVRTTGIETLVASTPDEYRERAVNLLTNRKALEVIRSDLSIQYKALTLGKYDDVAAALVTKIESLWCDWYSRNV